MHWIRRVFWRLQVLFGKGRAERELDEELSYHLEKETQANIRSGMTPDEARRKAMVDFGGVERAKEQVRDTRGARGLDDLVQDVRYANRSFARRPGFTLTAVALMALGVGATATIFSVVDGVLLKPLPYPDSDRIVYVDGLYSHTTPDFLAWRESLQLVEDLSARAGGEGSLTAQDGPSRVRLAHVTPAFLRLLGGRPFLGRLFVEEDENAGTIVVVLDHGFWVRSWGADPSVVGRQLRLDGEPVVVAGVLDPAFTPPEAVTEREVDVWRLLDTDGTAAENRSSHALRVLGRLREGTTLQAAQTEMDALTSSLAQEFPEEFVTDNGSPMTFPYVPLQEVTVREVSTTLYLLLGAVGLLLLIACANVANLFLARGTSRAAELSLRGALGASRGRIARQLLTESAFLALAGGALGVLVAYLGVDAFTRLGPSGVPRLAEVGVDLRVLSFALGISGATGVLCGVFPVFQAVGRRGKTSAASHGRVTPGRGGRRIRNVLVVTELGLTVVLLTGAGLLFRSLLERIQVDPGFEPENRIVVPLELGDSYDREGRSRFVLELRESLGTIPGVQRVAAAWVAPLVFPPDACCWASDVTKVGEEAHTELESTFIHPVSEEYFETLGISLSAGREFQPTDVEDDPMVAVLNTHLARRLFGSEEAIGRQIMVGANGPVTVIGVEPGHHHWTLDTEVDEAVYFPYGAWGNWFGMLHVVLETSVPISTLAPGLRTAVAELDPDMALGEVLTMEQLISRSLATPRFLSILFGVFAAVAFLLACGGVYASMLYSVGQRQREMGIRLAMGAQRGQVTGMVLRTGAKQTVLGLGLGLLLALGLSRLLAGLVWGVPVTDPGTYAAVCALLGATALAACWIPARRASRTDLVETLKAE